mgnify:CR=1 FL=1
MEHPNGRVLVLEGGEDGGRAHEAHLEEEAGRVVLRSPRSFAAVEGKHEARRRLSADRRGPLPRRRPDGGAHAPQGRLLLLQGAGGCQRLLHELTQTSPSIENGPE